MYRNGQITKGLSGQGIPAVEERIYLLNNGDNESDLTGGWDSEGYSLYNGKTIVRGHNRRSASSTLEISSPGIGQASCVLLGTQAPIPVNIKRYLVIEAKINDRTENHDHKVIISKSKELAQSGTTIYKSWGYEETFLKYYIDLSELTGFDRAYIAIAGNVTDQYWMYESTLTIKSVYLTNKRDGRITPLYNRGNDYSSYVEGQEADKLFGWRAYSGSSVQYKVAPTFEDDYIDLAATNEKSCAIESSRLVNLKKMGRIGVYIDVYEAAENATLYFYVYNGVGTIGSVITRTGKQVVYWRYDTITNLYGPLDDERIVIDAGVGLKAKVIGIWMEQ